MSDDTTPAVGFLKVALSEGTQLLEAKALSMVPPGQFGSWVDRHYPNDRQGAYGRMRLAVHAQTVGADAAIEAVCGRVWADLKALVREHGVEFAQSPDRGRDMGRLLAQAVQTLPSTDLRDAGEEWWNV